MEEVGVQTSREEVERKWTRCLAEEFGKDVEEVRDLGEMERELGLKAGEILNVILEADMSESERASL